MIAADGKTATLIQPDMRLQRKLKGANFKIDQRAIGRAVATGEKFIADRADWFGEEIRRLHQYHAGQTIEGALSANAVDTILKISYEARGNGATFDYSLITRIGASLTRFMESRKLGAAHRSVIDLHIDAMKDVVDAGLNGDGGARGRDLLERLAKAAADAPGDEETAGDTAAGDTAAAGDEETAGDKEAAGDKDAQLEPTRPVKQRRPVEDKDPSFFEKRTRSLIENYDKLDRSNGVPDATVKAFRETIENLIDQAPTYNYVLVADIGDSLLSLLDGGPIDAGRAKLLDSHMGCLNMAVNRKMRGDAGFQGKLLLANLKRMTED